MNCLKINGHRSQAVHLTGFMFKIDCSAKLKRMIAPLKVQNLQKLKYIFLFIEYIN